MVNGTVCGETDDDEEELEVMTIGGETEEDEEDNVVDVGSDVGSEVGSELFEEWCGWKVDVGWSVDDSPRLVCESVFWDDVDCSSVDVVIGDDVTEAAVVVEDLVCVNVFEPPRPVVDVSEVDSVDDEECRSCEVAPVPRDAREGSDDEGAGAEGDCDE